VRVISNVGLLSLVFASKAYAGGLSEEITKVGLIIFIVLAVVLLIGREFVCWYFKINERVGQLDDIKRLLTANSPEKASQKQVVARQTGISELDRLSKSIDAKKTSSCPKCQLKYPGDTYECPDCQVELVFE